MTESGTDTVFSGMLVWLMVLSQKSESFGDRQEPDNWKLETFPGRRSSHERSILIVKPEESGEGLGVYTKLGKADGRALT